MFGLNWYQTTCMLSLIVIAVTNIAIALVVTSKYYSVKYISPQEAETDEFVQQVREFVRAAISNEAKRQDTDSIK